MVRPAARTRPEGRLVAALVGLWLLVAVPVATGLFLSGSRTTVVAGHDTVVRPALDGYATADLGPYIPDLRLRSGGTIGARLDLGPTDAESYEALIERYAFIASSPEAQVTKVRGMLVDLAVDSALLGGLLGLSGPGLVLLVGRRRWHELRTTWTVRRTAVAAVVGALVAAGLVVTRDSQPAVAEVTGWQPLAEAVPDVRLPEQAAGLEIETGLITSGTRRLVASAIASYRTSLEFYSGLVERVPALADQLRQPGEGEVVGVLVSDRHDNIGMDPVARALADAAGATFLMNAGDDTSTGSAWESFSLESLAEAFADVDDRYAVAGNHDHGDFVVERLDDLGFTMLDGEPVEGPEGIRLLGASDVRSSGLGAWRDEREVSFGEQQQLIAELACELDADGERVSTLLVHDANSGRIALERGCVDLVLAGHLHLQVGPERVEGANGRAGYRYTTGTTGGAAYAVAIGSKLRRDAQVSFVTYAGGRPIGVQAVTVRTNGDLEVSDWTALELDQAEEPADE
ncbi:MAG TPA: metallophosphoesterase [Nocardioides sp.]|nr:metallophosphoesterase [Nocardioides sp.]